jgi:hypothetical protein
MSTTLKIRDETTFSLGGDDDRGFTLDLPEEQITVRELIRARVYQEVHDYNLDQPEYFQGLVQPSDAERQFELARRAFYSNGFILLVDDRQVDELEEEIEIKPDTTVTFLKLVPLVGG